MRFLPRLFRSNIRKIDSSVFLLWRHSIPGVSRMILATFLFEARIDQICDKMDPLYIILYIPLLVVKCCHYSIVNTLKISSTQQLFHNFHISFFATLTKVCSFDLQVYLKKYCSYLKTNVTAISIYCTG